MKNLRNYTEDIRIDWSSKEKYRKYDSEICEFKVRNNKQKSARMGYTYQSKLENKYGFKFDESYIYDYDIVA